MNFTFLEASQPLTKAFAADGPTLVKTPYPMVRDYTSHTVSAKSLAEFNLALKAHAARGHCLLKGNTTKNLNQESRAGSTDANAETGFVCLDFDRFDLALAGCRSLDDALDMLGLGDVSYVVQYSASAGLTIKHKDFVPDETLSCHVFMLLSKPLPAPLLKQHLMSLNLNTRLEAQIKLTRTGNALRWPLDITTCQNDKLLYIADPVLGKGITCSVKQRIKLVDKELEAIPSSRIAPDINKVRQQAQDKLTTLRKESGLHAIRTNQYKSADGMQILSKPGEAVITGMKVERGFVYFNLNGGDSWAYYHAEGKPEYILNFKGEPAYLTRELLPSYWASLTRVTPIDSQEEQHYLVGRDFASSRYFNAVWTPGDNHLDFSWASSENQLKHFLRQYGQPVPEFIVDWDIGYDPTSDEHVDMDKCFINTYHPGSIVPLDKPKAKLPPTIKRVMENAIGTGDLLDHFLNWVAVITYDKIKTGTAWVLHGVQGTGKGILFHKILTPLLGETNCSGVIFTSIDGQYNDWMENKQLVMVDEIQNDSSKSKTRMATLKNAITEPYMQLRKKFANEVKLKSYLNMIFASNAADPIEIDTSDRRFNMGAYADQKLLMTEADMKQIDIELPEFVAFMQQYPRNIERARSIQDTEDRQNVIRLSWSSIDVVSERLLQGDASVLVENLPQLPDLNRLPASAQMPDIEYVALVKAVLGTMPDRLTRDELYTITNYLVGGVPKSPAKFSRYLGHHRIHVKPMRKDGGVVQGIAIEWKQDAAWFAEQLAAFFPASNIVGMKKKA